MSKSLNINNPMDKTYGVISPNFKKTLEIGIQKYYMNVEEPIFIGNPDFYLKEKWDNVFTYTYGIMFEKLSGYKMSIKNQKDTRRIPEMFKEYEYNVVINTIKKALEESYNAKLEDPEFLNNLLATGNNKLIFDRFEIDPNYSYTIESDSTSWKGPVTPESFPSPKYTDKPLDDPIYTPSPPGTPSPSSSPMWRSPPGSPKYMSDGENSLKKYYDNTSPIYYVETKSYVTKNLGNIEYKVKLSPEKVLTRFEEVLDITDKRLKKYIGLNEKDFLKVLDEIDKYIKNNPSTKNILLQSKAELSKIDNILNKYEKTVVKQKPPGVYLEKMRAKKAILEKDISNYEKLDENEIPYPSVVISKDIDVGTKTLNKDKPVTIPYDVDDDKKFTVKNDLRILNLEGEINNMFPEILEKVRVKVQEKYKDNMRKNIKMVYSYFTSLIRNGSNDLKEYSDLLVDKVVKGIPDENRLVIIDDIPSKLMDYTLSSMKLDCMVKYLRSRYLQDFRNRIKSNVEDKMMFKLLEDTALSMGIDYNSLTKKNREEFKRITFLKFIDEDKGEVFTIKDYGPTDSIDVTVRDSAFVYSKVMKSLPDYPGFAGGEKKIQLYEIKEGDTLESVAKKYNTTPAFLNELNKSRFTVENVKPGQVISIQSKKLTIPYSTTYQKQGIKLKYPKAAKPIEVYEIGADEEDKVRKKLDKKLTDLKANKATLIRSCKSRKPSVADKRYLRKLNLQIDKVNEKIEKLGDYENVSDEVLLDEKIESIENNTKKLLEKIKALEEKKKGDVDTKVIKIINNRIKNIRSKIDYNNKNIEISKRRYKIFKDRKSTNDKVVEEKAPEIGVDDSDEEKGYMSEEDKEMAPEIGVDDSDGEGGYDMSEESDNEDFYSASSCIKCHNCKCQNQSVVGTVEREGNNYFEFKSCLNCLTEDKDNRFNSD